MGYGSRALSVLSDFFSGKLVNLDEAQKEVGGEDFKTVAKFDKVSNLRRIANHYLTNSPFSLLERRYFVR